MPDRVRRVLRPPAGHRQTGDDAYKPELPGSAAIEGRRREKRLLAELKPYPLQQEYFRDLPDAALRELAADIDRNGLRQLIEVVPGNTIVSGHQRKRALELLGRAEVIVLVRYDLEKAGPEAAEAYFLEANDLRRQLGPLERLAVIMRRLELEPKGAHRRQGEIRELIGAKVGITGRHVSRLLKLLALPPSIRSAVDDQRITLKDAERCLSLDAERLEQIGQAARAGDDVGKLIRNAIGTVKQGAPPCPAIGAKKIRRELLQWCRTLERDPGIAECCDERDIRLLARIERSIRGLRQRIEETAE